MYALTLQQGQVWVDYVGLPAALQQGEIFVLALQRGRAQIKSPFSIEQG